ncbi:MAG: hypothetical protein B6I24_03180 [Bacteroidetes bacterium 4572_128]|nr:MAG: hypothetical protein B6I24_03180 [Bacteroidetes bacterium 4572_128]
MAKKLINWTERYSVFYDEIDKQHKKLIDMINELYDSFSNGKANEVLEEILLRMIKYTDYHFKTEEKYFAKYSFSDEKAHIKEHEEFVLEVSKFYDDFKKKNLNLSYEVMNFLRTWLLKHILGSDKKYTNEFKLKNIKEL